jgi:hypothetical protein
MNEIATTPVTTEELNAFISALSAALNSYGRTEYPTCPPNWEVCFLDGGTKYARISKQTEEPLVDGKRQHRGVHCFVDLSNGNILKAAGYKGPDKKNPRGNIRVGDASNRWNEAFMTGCRHTSYLR